MSRTQRPRSLLPARDSRQPFDQLARQLPYRGLTKSPHHDDPIRPHAERVHHQVGDTDPSIATRNTLQMDDMVVRQYQLVRVLDHDEPLVGGYLSSEGSQERALACAGRPRDQHISARDDDTGEQLGSVARQPVIRFPRWRGAAQRQRHARELSDRYRRTADGCDDRVRSTAVAHSRVNVGPLNGQLAPNSRRDAMRELAHGCGVAESNSDTLEAPAALNEDLLRSVYEHVGHVLVVQERLHGTKSEQLRA